MKLLLEAAAKMLGGMLLMGLVLFLPAGTWHYPNGWLFCILLFLAMPLVLGSWISFGIMLLYPAVLVFRIRGEEKVLEEGLEGYAAYEQRVRYRLIPFLW